MYSEESKLVLRATKELGYKELRPNQEAAIRNFLGSKDLKPLCYCLLPRVYDELRQTLYRHGTTDLGR